MSTDLFSFQKISEDEEFLSVLSNHYKFWQLLGMQIVNNVNGAEWSEKNWTDQERFCVVDNKGSLKICKTLTFDGGGT